MSNISVLSSLYWPLKYLKYPLGPSLAKQYFLLYEGGDSIQSIEVYWHTIYWPGPQEVSRLLLLAAGAWADQLHEEVWVYNQGFWSKDHTLWKEIQKADWKDVILNDAFKKALQKDVYGFFTSEAIYKELGIPWKVFSSVSEHLTRLNFWCSAAWSCMGLQVSSLSIYS